MNLDERKHESVNERIREAENQSTYAARCYYMEKTGTHRKHTAQTVRDLDCKHKNTRTFAITHDSLLGRISFQMKR